MTNISTRDKHSHTLDWHTSSMKIHCTAKFEEPYLDTAYHEQGEEDEEECGSSHDVSHNQPSLPV